LPLNVFSYQDSDLRDGPSAFCQKYVYISGRDLGVGPKIYSDFLPTHSPNFYTVSKVQNLAASIFDTSRLWCFWSGSICRKFKTI